MKPSARWTLSVSSDTDERVRRLLEKTERKGQLSEFVEDAVKARLLELQMQECRLQPRGHATDVDPAHVEVRIDNERQYGK